MLRKHVAQATGLAFVLLSLAFVQAEEDAKKADTIRK